MRFVKFIMSKGGSFTVNAKKADEILNSEKQLVKITDKNGVWTGDTINQAHIIQTFRDTEAEERQESIERHKRIKLEAPPEDPKKKAKIDKVKKEISKKWKKNTSKN